MKQDIALDFQKHIVTNFKEYLDVVKSLKSKEENLWFRGQDNASFQLVPSALRNCYEIKDQFDRDIKPQKLTEYNNKGNQVAYINVHSMLQEFKLIAKQHLRIEPTNNLEWHFIAQHYGIPTKLLDWSTDSLVALFFAIQKNREGLLQDNIENAIEDFRCNSYSDKGASVFVVNPGELNKVIAGYTKGGTEEPIDFTLNSAIYNEQIEKGFLDGSNQLLPCCITSTPIDKRICRQSGNFTIHGSFVWPIDHIDQAKKIIHKIFIPYNCIEEMKEMLYALDVTENSLYGHSDLDSYSKDISNKNQEKLRLAVNELKIKYNQQMIK
ncbi:FRG domain-containing protein [Bacillus sp. K2I17]|uniref:FRG domain-containing protein n=1 Tax=Bacillus sp. K2I17 TaxID=2014743 RepID=UPI000B51ACA3|nr:FRG domain-containing protein [Bacillus sp. K2I17]OWT49331.1 hypothetical protein CER22_21255 [Bacillus sp. K2I17]